MENQRHRIHHLEDELKSLRTKYDDVCERISAATHQLEKVKVILEETSHRCELLEKEKVEMSKYMFLFFNEFLFDLVQLRKKLVLFCCFLLFSSSSYLFFLF